MTFIVVGAPGDQPPPPPSPPRPPPPPSRGEAASFKVLLTGVDGSEWDLTQGNVLLAPGGQLFAAPEVSHWWTNSPVVNGSRWDGMRTGRADRSIPVFVLGDDWESWRDTDSAFFRAVHPRGECLVTVVSPDAKSRSMGFRFVSGGDVEMDPLTRFFAAYNLEFTVATPFWAGEMVTYSFTADTPVPLFPGPPFNINRSVSTESATVTNPGDEDAWPRYRVVGPMESWTVGVGESLISSETPLLAGESITIDSDRTKLTVLDQDGVNVYGQLEQDVFAPIPSGENVPLSLTVVGGGPGSGVEVEFTPLYRRAW